MFKVILLAAVLIGFTVLGVGFFSKLPEIKNTEKIEEPIQPVQQKATSSAITKKESPTKVILKQSLPTKIELPPVVQKSAPIPFVPETPTTTPIIQKVEIPVRPSLDEEALLRAIVKIQCPTSDGLGKYVGSGFVFGERTVITAAHVIKDSGNESCEVIFSKERKPIHYLKGTIINLKETIRRHDEEGIDVGILRLPEISAYPEALAIFTRYPSIPYSICSDPRQIGDKLLHFGYPSNYLDQSYLSELTGETLAKADIKGVEDRVSLDGGYTYKSPILDYTDDESRMYPYMFSRVPSFYGDSGGLAFNADKQCVIGPHRGGTIGRAAGENYSVFMNLAWEKAKNLLH